jgi:hypothetical protein
VDISSRRGRRELSSAPSTDQRTEELPFLADTAQLRLCGRPEERLTESRLGH